MPFKTLRAVLSPIHQPSTATSVLRSLTIHYAAEPTQGHSVAHADCLANPLSPLRFKVLDTLHHQPRDKLVWSFNANTSRSKLPRAVTRNRLSRRWSAAFRTALRARGFESDGTRMEPPGGENRDGITKRTGVELKGTMQVLLVNAAGWDSIPEDLVRDAEGIVGALEKEMATKKSQGQR